MDITPLNSIKLKKDIMNIKGIIDINVRFSLKSNYKETQFTDNLFIENLKILQKEIYEITDGIRFKWLYKNQEYKYHVCSDALILSLNGLQNGLHTVFKSEKRKKGKRHENYLWDEKDNKEFIEQIENDYYILDRFDQMNYSFTLLKFDPEVKFKLFLYKFPDRLYQLNLSLREYFEKAYDFRMIDGWQDLFINRDNCDKKLLDSLEKERSYPVIQRYDEIFNNKRDDVEKYISSYEMMAYKNKYEEKLELSINKLKSKISLKSGDANFHYKKPLSIHCIRKIETILDRKLPDSMLSFYSQINGLSGLWTYEDKENIKSIWSPMGDFWVMSLEEVFGGKEPTDHKYWHDRMWDSLITINEVWDKKEMEFAKQFRPIIFEASSRITTLIRFVEKIEEPEVWIKDGIKFLKLSINFNDVIENLLSNLFINFWQYQYVEDEEFKNSRKEEKNYPPVSEFKKILFQ